MTRPDDSGTTALLARLVQGVGKLVSDHLALARLEIGEDLDTIAARLGTIVVFLLPVLAGYALLCGALAVFVGRWLTLAGALLAVGGVNLVVGAIGLRVASARLRLPEKVDEIVGDVQAQALASVGSTLIAIDRRAQEAVGPGR